MHPHPNPSTDSPPASPQPDRDARLAARFDAILAAPFGRVGVRADAQCVHAIHFLPERFAPRGSDLLPIQLLAVQLEAYYADPDAPLDVPLAGTGTDFQRRVWQAIRAVRRGRTATYGELAANIGGTARAVGQACGDNPFPLVVPCHRVVGAKGLGGFAHHGEDGFHLEVKRWLLRHERVMLL
ncbi:methylated-DNA--[protein]-cysteine S-methyltransferase [Cupriavidus sp. UGS-1]|uniref:methylated-DNA--[protein]-cysteine S-methyltransferase n=1 Tax=Cupriavidus sp. UGS-1 TaxID=2899826 RepID=UPI001E2F05B2|nr:methylated-DNA--[protein]-cysteine S-methyltransferase [Cupriavidus sp. UGS-1]MCD9121393.1 methylated-DNA--[protein]-cysteine S-methyltransferase [Cupriavidus sp. UGS-1]